MYWGVRKFFARRLNRLLVPVLFWNTFYMIMQILSQINKGIIVDLPLCMIDKYLSFKYNGFMWFFIPLICLYLSMPFLSVFVLNSKRGILKLFIVMSMIMNTIGCLSVPNGAHFYDIYIFGTRYLLFAVAGYYLGNYKISVLTRRKIYVLGWISVLIILFGTLCLQYNIPDRYDFFLQYTNMPCTITAFAVFIFCKNTNWEKLFCKYKLNVIWLINVSSLSLGIYLFQSLGFRLIGKIELLNNCLLLRFVSMYILCITIVIIMKRIPILKKFV